MNTSIVGIANITSKMRQYVQVAWMEGRLTATKAKMKTVKTSITCLLLDTVYGLQTELCGPMILLVTTSIRPTITATIVTETP